MESNIKKQAEPQKAHEAILSDTGIKQLIEKKTEIYSMSTPFYMLHLDGTMKAIYDTKTKTILEKLDQQIEVRKQQILSFYNCL